MCGEAGQYKYSKLFLSLFSALCQCHPLLIPYQQWDDKVLGHSGQCKIEKCRECVCVCGREQIKEDHSLQTHSQQINQNHMSNMLYLADPSSQQNAPFPPLLTYRIKPKPDTQSPVCSRLADLSDIIPRHSDSLNYFKPLYRIFVLLLTDKVTPCL